MNETPMSQDQIDAARDRHGLAAPPAPAAAAVVRTPVEGISGQIGGHVEKIHRLKDQLLAEFERYETARAKLSADHRIEFSADFGGPINAALEHWRQMQKPAGVA